MRGETECSRRGLLRAAGGMAVCGLVSTAGCTTGIPPLGKRVQFGRVDAPPADDPTYTRWLPAAGALPGGRDHAHMTQQVSPREVIGDDAEVEVALPVSLLAQQLDYLGSPVESHDRLVTVGPSTILVDGGVDATAVGDTVTGGGYELVGSLAEYDLYRRRDGERTLAVCDSRLLFCLRGPSDTGRERIRTVLRARRGDAPRRHQVDDGFGALVEAVGERSWGWHAQGSRDDLPAAVQNTSVAFEATPDGVYFFRAFLYPDDDIDRSRLESALAERTRPLHSEATEIETRGRVAVAQMHMTREKWRQVADRSPDTWPLVTWIPEGDGDEVRFHHEGGDTVEASRLDVRIDAPDDFEYREEFASEYDEVGPGDAPALDTGDHDAGEIELVYNNDDGSLGVIAGYDLGGGDS